MHTRRGGSETYRTTTQSYGPGTQGGLLPGQTERGGWKRIGWKSYVVDSHATKNSTNGSLLIQLVSALRCANKKRGTGESIRTSPQAHQSKFNGGRTVVLGYVQMTEEGPRTRENLGGRGGSGFHAKEVNARQVPSRSSAT